MEAGAKKSVLQTRLLRVPTTAWPTVLVAILGSVSHVALLLAAATRLMPLALAFLLAVVVAFVNFTPMHDASHRSLSQRRWLNEGLGIVCSISLFAPFTAFRYAHLQHHRHTNDAEKDPDFVAGKGPRWLLPFRWLTIDVHYYIHVLRNWSAHSVRARTEMTVQLSLILGLLFLLVALGFGEATLWVWVIPARLAIALLAFAFDYLPHVPYQTTSKVNRYQATRILKGRGLVGAGLSGLFLYQNYHLIHHLYPAVPFYRYGKVFAQVEPELRAKGATITEVRGG